APAASSRVSMLAKVCSVCSTRSSLTTLPVSGSKPPWPDRKIHSPTVSPGEYGPAGVGIFSELTRAFTAGASSMAVACLSYRRPFRPSRYTRWRNATAGRVTVRGNEPPRLTIRRGLAHRAPSARTHPARGKRPQLLRLRARPSLRDHLPAPGPRLLNGDGGTGSRGDHGHVGDRHPAGGSPARPLLRQSARRRRKPGERGRLRGLRLRRPSVAGL